MGRVGVGAGKGSGDLVLGWANPRILSEVARAEWAKWSWPSGVGLGDPHRLIREGSAEWDERSGTSLSWPIRGG